jgi:hypothetical protein
MPPTADSWSVNIHAYSPSSGALGAPSLAARPPEPPPSQLRQAESDAALPAIRPGVPGAEPNGQALSDEDEAIIRQLESRDREVRQHETNHIAMLGPYARGGPSYVFQVGPDDKSYAVGGSVTASVGREKSDAATAAKATRVRAAALAGGDPSAADAQAAATVSRHANESGNLLAVA